MKIIVGLGNPGQKYSKTRHNIGWLFIDYLSKIYNVDVTKSNCDALTGETKINGEKILFAKPITFMNLSGNSVSKLKKWYKVENKDIIIIFDDTPLLYNEIACNSLSSSIGLGLSPHIPAPNTRMQSTFSMFASVSDIICFLVVAFT